MNVKQHPIVVISTSSFYITFQEIQALLECLLLVATYYHLTAAEQQQLFVYHSECYTWPYSHHLKRHQVNSSMMAPISGILLSEFVYKLCLCRPALLIGSQVSFIFKTLVPQITYSASASLECTITNPTISSCNQHLPICDHIFC